ncbi:M12 family metallopeptidase [Asticcacaulis sp. 201]|uniref:M12 family metallopeptidase n=1 Tax=Asticcacaulis sp. 201 TaxID=3028787 RepID=UPI002916313C|nr:M12 family metallopeptidase [Asticcacaulis sp. 201]MDV6329823.1 M12 family metallopeptidase [Asticcacaulis sp. 201]
MPGISCAAAVQDGTKPWSDAVVPYHFDPALLKRAGAKGANCTGWRTWSVATSAAKACRAMDEWSTETGVRFVHDKKRLDSLYIVGSVDATNATLGHLPAFNQIQIEAKASYGSVLHEFGHVLGLIHEHQRPDRDEYLTLSPFLKTYLDRCGLSLSAVCRDVRNAFPTLKVQMLSPYDPCSDMHYLANQAPRHREDARWSRIFTLTAKGKAALKACLPQFAARPARCRTVGQKCAIARDDAAIVRRFQGLAPSR